MSEHTDETIIRQLRETVERQAEDNRRLVETCEIINSDRRQLFERLDAMSSELDELRRLVEPFGTGSFPFVYAGDEIAVSRCRQYNKRKAEQCRKST